MVLLFGAIPKYDKKKWNLVFRPAAQKRYMKNGCSKVIWRALLGNSWLPFSFFSIFIHLYWDFAKILFQNVHCNVLSNEANCHIIFDTIEIKISEFLSIFFCNVFSLTNILVCSLTSIYGKRKKKNCFQCVFAFSMYLLSAKLE